MSNILATRPNTKHEIEATHKKNERTGWLGMTKAFAIMAGNVVLYLILDSVFKKAEIQNGSFDILCSVVQIFITICAFASFVNNVFVVMESDTLEEPLEAIGLERLQFLSMKYPQIKTIVEKWKSSEVGLLQYDIKRIEDFIQKNPELKISSRFDELETKPYQLSKPEWIIKPSNKSLIS